MRRTASLSSIERSTAQRHWQTTLQERLGTPGQPPGRDELPSLWDRRSNNSAMRPMPCGSSVSTAGPSASIVAWFAQFRCESCGRIPLVLDAKFCMACGGPLEIKVPSELVAQMQALKPAPNASASQLSKAKPSQDRQPGPSAREGRSLSLGAPHPPVRKGERAPPISAAGMLVARAERKGKAVKQAMLAEAAAANRLLAQGPGRPPRPPPVGKDWAARESQVALWLDSIKPRMPMKSIPDVKN